MSHAIALPAPRGLRLPRVRFKRPRWPRGNRLALVTAVVFTALAVYDVARVIWPGLPSFPRIRIPHLSNSADDPLADFATDVTVAAIEWWLWWWSRRNGGGPDTT